MSAVLIVLGMAFAAYAIAEHRRPAEPHTTVRDDVDVTELPSPGGGWSGVVPSMPDQWGRSRRAGCWGARGATGLTLTRRGKLLVAATLTAGAATFGLLWDFVPVVAR